MRSAYTGNPEDHAQACALLEALCEGYVRAMVVEIESEPDGAFPCCIKCGGLRTRNAPLTPAQAQAVQGTLRHGHPSGTQRELLDEILADHGYPREQWDANGLEIEDDGPSAMGDSPPGVAYQQVQSSPTRGGLYEDALTGTKIPPAGAEPFTKTLAQTQLGGGIYTIAGSMPYLRRNEAPPSSHATIQVRSAREILAAGCGHTVELACYQCAQKRLHSDPNARVMILCTEPGTFRGVVACSDYHEKPERRGTIDDPVVDARPVGACGCGGDHAQAQ